MNHTEIKHLFCRDHSCALVTMVALLIAHLGVLSHGILRNFPNVDELAHLPAGISHWKYERFDLYRVNPPLVRLVGGLVGWISATEYDWQFYSKKPGRRTEFNIGVDKLEKDRLLLHRAFIGPRFATLLFPLIGVFVFSYWLQRVETIWVAVLGCGFWCFSPNMLAFGQTIGPDVGAVAMGVLASLCAWDYSLRPGFRTAFISGVFLGIAVLAKLTWLTAFLTFPATMLIVLAKLGLLRGQLCRRIKEISFVLFVALVTLNAGYLFDGTGTALGDFLFSSEAFGGPGSSPNHLGNRFYGTRFEKIPVPLPRDFVMGVDWLRMEVETKRWSFLLGEWKFGSWIYYYLVTTLFKTQEPMMIAAMIGFCVLVVGIWRKRVETRVVAFFLFLSIPASAIFASVSIQGGFNHHHRYVLQVYPLVFALAAYVASPVSVQLLRSRLPFAGPKKRSVAIPFAIVLAALSVVSTLRVHPHYTSYFNTISGGPKNGWRLLGFSNIDWGQDILDVAQWLKLHPDCRPLVMDLDYFGMNGELFEVQSSMPPELPKQTSIAEIRRSVTETQWWIISVKKLYNLPEHSGLEYLQQVEPTDKIAYAYHVYRIDPIHSSDKMKNQSTESEQNVNSDPSSISN